MSSGFRITRSGGTEAFDQTAHDALSPGHHANTNDPSAGEKAALAGTAGTPSGTNKYVTNDDARNTDARTPTSHADAVHSGANKHAIQVDGVAVDTQATTDFEAGANIVITGSTLGGVQKVNIRASGLASSSHSMASHSDDGALATLNTVGTSQIDDNAVTLAKLADIATASFLGRTTAATGDPEVLTATQATALLSVFTDALKGLVPASGGGTTTFLRADGAFAAPTATAADPAYAPGTFTVETGTGRWHPKRLELTTTQRATLAGTGRLVIA